MNNKILSIILICILANGTVANMILDGKGADEIAGYILSPVIGLSKIHLFRKLHHQVNFHVPMVPYVDSKKAISPISESYFEIDDDDDDEILDPKPIKL